MSLIVSHGSALASDVSQSACLFHARKKNNEQLHGTRPCVRIIISPSLAYLRLTARNRFVAGVGFGVPSHCHVFTTAVADPSLLFSSMECCVAEG